MANCFPFPPDVALRSSFRLEQKEEDEEEKGGIPPPPLAYRYIGLPISLLFSSAIEIGTVLLVIIHHVFFFFFLHGAFVAMMM